MHLRPDSAAHITKHSVTVACEDCVHKPEFPFERICHVILPRANIQKSTSCLLNMYVCIAILLRGEKKLKELVIRVPPSYLRF
jgi:hypothetical protein